MAITDAILDIQETLDRWRNLGSLCLRNGIELMGRFPDVVPDTWTHIVFPGLDEQQLVQLERAAGARLTGHVRAFYRRIGGMTLFTGAFRVASVCRRGFRVGDDSLCPDDIATLNHDLDVLGWKPTGAVAFAVNGLDGSVHLAGMGRTPDEIVRCDRVSGRVLETHDDVFECIADRLTSLDRLHFG